MSLKCKLLWHKPKIHSISRVMYGVYDVKIVCGRCCWGFIGIIRPTQVDECEFYEARAAKGGVV